VVRVKRQTKQRDEVRVALAGRDAFVSAQELHLELAQSGSGIGLATVYRALNSLVDEGVADALTREGQTVFRACDPGHHHHLVCRECGVTIEIHADEVEAWAKRVASDHGFVAARHVVDVFGLCPQCQNSVIG
jgi:Fur family transcriptional regulator, ferric uptake regulator